MKKLYVVVKYVKAENALDAIQIERNIPAHDTYIYDSWKSNGVPNLNAAAGLTTKVADDDSLDTIT